MDPVTVLTGYLALVELVPSDWVVPALGAVGTPANIYAILALLWYAGAWFAGRAVPAAGTRAPRVAVGVFAACVLVSYVSLAEASRSPVQLETQAADRGLIGLVAWFGLVVVASAGIRDYQRLRLLLRRAVLMGSAVAALGIVEFFLKRDLLSSIHIPGLQPSGVAAAEIMIRGGFARPSSTAAHPLELSGVLAMLLPFAIQQALDRGVERGAWRRWAPVALIGGALPLTVSRTSIIGLVVVLLVLLPTWPSGRRWPALGVIALAAGAVKLAVPGLISTTANLFGTFLGNSDNSTKARTMDYSGVAPYVAQRPLFGRGFGTFIPSLYRYTDNMFLLSVVEIGVIGVLALAGLYVTGMWCGRAGRRRFTDDARRELGQSFVAAMAAAMVISATFDSLGFEMFAGVFFLLLGCAGAYLGIARRGDRPSAQPAEQETIPILIGGVPRLRPRADGDPRAYPRPVAPTAFALLASYRIPGEDDGRPPPTPPRRRRPAAGDLAGSVRSGVRWSLVNTAVMRIGNFAVGVVLARGLLGPREWGLYAIGLVALSVLLAFNELGVSLAMIRWEGDPKRFAPTVLTLSAASSTLLYLMLYAIAPHVARLLGAPDATSMLRVLGIAVLIDGLACVPGGMLTRTFAQRQRMIIDGANFVVSSALTIGLAASGAGAISFAWGSVTGNVVSLIGCAIVVPGMLKPGWDREQARALIRFGLPLAGASLLVLAMLNVDSMIVGATLGPVALGLYQVAFNISSWPVRSVSEVARRVSFAGFSRVADSPAALADAFGRGLALLMAAAVPACVLLTILAKPLIHVIYGTQWTSASGALRFLAMLGLLRVAFELAYDCLVAVGRRRELLFVQGWWLVVLIPVLIYTARWRGIAGVGFGHVLVAAPLVTPVFVFALARAGISPLVIASACARPFIGGAVMAVVALGAQQLNLGLVPGVCAAIGLATAAYLPIVWPMRHLVRSAAPPLRQPQPLEAA